MKKIIFVACLAMLATGCFYLHPEAPPEPPVIEKAPLRLTTEEILQADDGDRIIVAFPQNVRKPIVVFDETTNQWVVSAKVIEQP